MKREEEEKFEGSSAGGVCSVWVCVCVCVYVCVRVCVCVRARALRDKDRDGNRHREKGSPYVKDEMHDEAMIR